MADNWVETTAGELRLWADEHGGGLDEQGARLLLDLVREEMGLGAPEELTPEGVRELLLEVFPESVVAGAEEVPAVLDTLRRLVAFLRDTRAVPAPRAAELAAEIERSAPAFAEVVAAADTAERQVAAEVIAGLMRADGVPLDDQGAVEAWVAEFEALPEDERYARTEEYLRQTEELVVPPVRLPAEGELAAAVRASELTGRAVALAEWADGRALTEHDQLTEADAEAARDALGMKLTRGYAQVEDEGALERLWWAAVEAEVISVADGAAGPGPALEGLRSADDAALLAAWLPLFDAVVVPEHDPEDGLDAMELVQNEMTGVLIHLYEQEEPTSPHDLLQALREHVGESYDLSDEDAMSGLVADAFLLELGALQEWGIVEVAGDGGRALTPLGVWGVRELLLADGFTAPLVGDLADASAAGLVEGLTWHRPDTADEEIAGWLASRDAKDAAADLLDVMRTGGPGARNLAAAVLHRIGPEAAPVVRAAREHPLVSPYAVLWLNAAGDPSGRELAREEYLWVFVDTVAGMLETAEPADAVEAALADAPPGPELLVMIDELWRTHHDDVADVLEALGDHHPDKATAKAARTAAYKARSSR
ncbi:MULTISPECIES: hypothetical protein [Actinomadura]|uniref:Uncharacterized protein n=1 Tax=Actinomadura litoris TaxID=2678616 RepID=A0A7K1LBK6_9ACTN|nr:MULTISPECIES: hypothetical protein [Actinomadura]MBT2209740.1 hypothetical protein [Actinomadura sp. NEAU-AAG7]MUN41802.1 hypothetical protein [Actinomadura litoris]